MKGSSTWWVASLASLPLLLAGCETGGPAAEAADSSGYTANEVIVGKEDNAVGVDGTVVGTDGTSEPDTFDSEDASATDGTDGSTEPVNPVWGTGDYWAKYFFPNAWVKTNATGGEYNLFNIVAFKVNNIDDVVIYNTFDESQEAGENPCKGTEGVIGLFYQPVDMLWDSYGFACITPDGKLVLSQFIQEDLHKMNFQGSFEEKLVETGYCAGGKADGARKCSRYTDCDDLQGASCKGLAVEIWMHLHYRYGNEDVTDDYLMDSSLFKPTTN